MSSLLTLCGVLFLCIGLVVEDRELWMISLSAAVLLFVAAGIVSVVEASQKK